nr:regulatory protein RecX [Limisalsivibrio acetivorans]
MREKLLSRFSREEADECMEKLHGYGYIDDLKFAENFTASRLNSGYGPYYILPRLKQKGVFVDEGFIENTAHAKDIDIEGIMRDTGKKYLEKKSGEDRIKVRQKTWAFLMRRGFEGRMIDKLIEELFDESNFHSGC